MVRLSKVKWFIYLIIVAVVGYVGWMIWHAHHRICFTDSHGRISRAELSMNECWTCFLEWPVNCVLSVEHDGSAKDHEFWWDGGPSMLIGMNESADRILIRGEGDNSGALWMVDLHRDSIWYVLPTDLGADRYDTIVVVKSDFSSNSSNCP
jgi:hypothetical protein